MLSAARQIVFDLKALTRKVSEHEILHSQPKLAQKVHIWQLSVLKRVTHLEKYSLMVFSSLLVPYWGTKLLP